MKQVLWALFISDGPVFQRICIGHKGITTIEHVIFATSKFVESKSMI